MKNLVIVESPSKSKTIEKYLGSNYHVVSSKGHIRDLKTSGKYGFGVDIENNFTPSYEPISGKKKVISELKKLSKESDMVYLASDPDREGEAISWHLKDALGLKDNDYERVVFNEITHDKVLEAFKHPRKIDDNLVKSQETRRILDRIIGFRLSKLMQSKTGGKSAGRVQSVALKLIVDREDEINKFIPEKYYTITAFFNDFEADIFRYKDKELEQNSTHKEFLLVQKEGNRNVKRNIDHYNLDMIIALGYRVQSQVATRFRVWATQRLHEYIQKGFALDDERLKQGGNRYFRELLQRIRDIRSSERNFYQQVTDIYATSIDYDPRSDLTKKFFATVQNKLHYAVHEHTAAEMIYERVDNEKPFVGMTNFKGDYVTVDDVKIAKNYLSEIELQRLNLLVSQFLDYAEFQALEQRAMTMNDWIEELDNQIIQNKRKLLEGNGKISHKEAIEKAEKEFEIYREREMKQLESDFDKVIKMLNSNKDN